MSNISTIHSFLYTQLSTVLTDYSKLTNPYFLEQEDDLMINKGYGIIFAPAIFADDKNIKNYIVDVERDFQLVLSQKSCSMRWAISNREDIEKDLFEDQLDVIQRLFSQTRNNVTNPYIIDLTILGDSGIEFIRNDRTDIMAIKTNIRIRYHEDV